MSERERREHTTRQGGSRIIEPPKPGKRAPADAPAADTQNEEKIDD